MTKHLVPFILALAVAGCGGPGTGTSERIESRDSASATPPPAQPAPQVIPPMPERSDMPEAKPTGWTSFDSYYDQLMKVVGLEISSEGNVPKEEFAALRERAQQLAKDTSPTGIPSQPQRATVADLIARAADLPTALPAAERLRAFQPVLLMSRDIAQTVPDKNMGPHMERLQLAAAQLDVVALRLQAQPPKR